MDPFGVLMVGVGLFTVLGGALNWDLFMNSRKAQVWVKLFSYNGARIFYIVVGGSLMIFGALMILEMLDGPAK
jgi:hypothetical protein